MLKTETKAELQLTDDMSGNRKAQIDFHISPLKCTEIQNKFIPSLKQILSD